ncbi:guanine nucleotide-binding protein G(I)/G(S)/G(O) subunit gamma-13b isoform X1 [Scomber scombrus]
MQQTNRHRQKNQEKETERNGGRWLAQTNKSESGREGESERRDEGYGHGCIECVCLQLNSSVSCVNITLASSRCVQVQKALHQAAVMDEMDLPQMKKEVESLKYQLAFKREKSSKTVTDLVKWIEDGVPEDPFLNPELMKNNPWVEKGKCILL